MILGTDINFAGCVPKRPHMQGLHKWFEKTPNFPARTPDGYVQQTDGSVARSPALLRTNGRVLMQFQSARLERLSVAGPHQTVLHPAYFPHSKHLQHDFDRTTRRRSRT